jgi:thymidylate kinase
MNGVRVPSGALIAIDGIDGEAVLAAAKRALKSRPRGGISRWDASGVFQDLAVAGSAAGAPSPRTLMLLYAADLAFRLRWQIRPALAEGRTVVAAPYVDTATAFGRAAGLPPSWLMNLFRFAPRPAQVTFVHAGARRAAAIKDGFVGFGCNRMTGGLDADARRRLIDGMKEILHQRDRRRRRG